MTRAWPKRAAKSATAATGLSTKCQTGREIFASGRHSGLSSCASIQSRTRRRASGFRRRWISATIPPTTTMNVPERERARATRTS